MKSKSHSGNKLLLGTASAAHQIEGGNIYNNWHKKEIMLEHVEDSGKAINSYELYKTDRKLLQDLGCNAYRFSIEWSRINPTKDEFKDEEIKHYNKVIDDLITNGITPIVTLHHFTNPMWFADLGGWLKSENVDYFTKYLEYLLPKLDKRVEYFITINEPNVYTASQYIAKAWYPYELNIIKATKKYHNLLEAHKRSYILLKKFFPKSMVSFATNHMIVKPIKDKFYLFNLLLASVARYLINSYFLNRAKDYIDYIALNFYGIFSLGFSFKEVVRAFPDFKMVFTNTGSSVYKYFPAETISIALDQLKKYNLPILITENGLLTSDDSERIKFLKVVFSTLKEWNRKNKSLIGYLHWTLIDNYEWELGYKAHYGLYSFNKETFERIPKPSAKVFKQLVSYFKTIHF